VTLFAGESAGRPAPADRPSQHRRTASPRPRVPRSLELAVLPLLTLEAQGIGCKEAVDEAREKPADKQGQSFAARCPPGKEKRVLAPKQAAKMPLWAVVLAVERELRARDSASRTIHCINR
jgi:hypothetical protein